MQKILLITRVIMRFHWIFKIRRGRMRRRRRRRRRKWLLSENGVEDDSQESYNDIEKRPQSGNIK